LTPRRAATRTTRHDVARRTNRSATRKQGCTREYEPRRPLRYMLLSGARSSPEGVEGTLAVFHSRARIAHDAKIRLNRHYPLTLLTTGARHSDESRLRLRDKGPQDPRNSQLPRSVCTNPVDFTWGQRAWHRAGLAGVLKPPGDDEALPADLTSHRNISPESATSIRPSTPGDAS
jgi:hypothetical protein